LRNVEKISALIADELRRIGGGRLHPQQGDAGQPEMRRSLTGLLDMCASRIANIKNELTRRTWKKEETWRTKKRETRILDTDEAGVPSQAEPGCTGSRL
jgi:hypothetical protein